MTSCVPRVKSVFYFTCPYCGAEQWKTCRTSKGRVTRPHRGRFKPQEVQLQVLEALFPAELARVTE